MKQVKQQNSVHAFKSFWKLHLKFSLFVEKRPSRTDSSTYKRTINGYSK